MLLSKLPALPMEARQMAVQVRIAARSHLSASG